MLVHWTAEAIHDLDDIESYIAKDDYERAVDFVEEIISCSEALSDTRTNRKGFHPEWAGSDDTIRELYYKGYTIVYEISVDDVVIHEVYNQSKIKLHFGKR